MNLESKAEPGEGDKPEGQITIAIAEDEAFNYLLLKEFLGHNNIHLLWFKDGKEICDYFESNNFPGINLVLMDIKMPRVDGFEATRRIKARFPELPIIAQTAFALQQDIEQMEGAGFSEVLTKPINKQQLLDAVKKFTV
jgi:two-component system, cell cycle response regulator DivK